MKLAALCFTLCAIKGASLNNGAGLVPPLGWSSWYGFTSNINEDLLLGIGDGLLAPRTLKNGSVTSLFAVGFRNVWVDDGFALPRDPVTNKVTVDPVLFPSGFRNLSAALHAKGLLFGVYTSEGPLTCLGYQPTQPKRPGSCGFEQIDAETYAFDWVVDMVKDDGCGQCNDVPFVAMRDALNATGRSILYTIHGPTVQGTQDTANMWRTGGDLYSSDFSMWTNRLDLATTAEQAAMTGPGSFPDPDFLEVGYSPRCTKSTSQTALEQRSMFTMWAALPTGLTLSADLRVGSDGLDEDALATLTCVRPHAQQRHPAFCPVLTPSSPSPHLHRWCSNTEVIAINQDPLAAPMRPVYNQSGLQVWRKPLAASGSQAVVFFFRGPESGPLPPVPAVSNMSIAWPSLGLAPGTQVAVRDLWAGADLGLFTGAFACNVTQREARIFTFVAQ